MSGLIEVAQFRSRLEADFAVGTLLAEGIDAQLFDVGMSDMGLGMMIPIRLMVLNGDREDALRILTDEALI